MLRDCCPPCLGEVEYCWDEPLNASEEDGRECSIVMVLEGVEKGVNTSAIGSGVVNDGCGGG